MGLLQLCSTRHSSARAGWTHRVVRLGAWTGLRLAHERDWITAVFPRPEPTAFNLGIEVGQLSFMVLPWLHEPIGKTSVQAAKLWSWHCTAL